MFRLVILGVFLLGACSSAEPPLMIDGSHSQAAAEDSSTQQAAASDETADKS